MQVLREQDAKRIATQKAVQGGHLMRPWRHHPSNHHRIRASCKRCGAELLVISEMLEPEHAESMKAQGTVIGRFERPTATDMDFTYISGGALLRCTGI